MHVDAETKSSIRQIFNSKPKAAAGCLHLVGLDDLKNRLGDRWESTKDRVHGFIEKLLQRTLSPGDVWFRHDEAQYVIIFARLEKHAAQAFCFAIVDQLEKTLFGESELESVKVHSAVAEVDGGFGVETASIEHILKFASEAASHALHGAGSVSPGRDDGPIAPDASLEERLQAFKQMLYGSNSEDKTWQLVYRPFWDAKHNVTSTYACLPHRARGNRVGLTGYSVIGDPNDTNSIFYLDMDVVSIAIPTFHDLFQNRFRYFLNIPVHFETLAVTKRRRDYLQLCRTIPRALIPFIGFELHGLPKGIPYSRLSELVTVLQPYSRAVLASTDIHSLDLPIYGQSGVKGISIDIESVQATASFADDIRHLSAAAKKAGLALYADGVHTAQTLQLLETCGAQFIGGPVIGSDSEAPEHMRRYTGGELLLRSHTKLQQRSFE